MAVDAADNDTADYSGPYFSLIIIKQCVRGARCEHLHISQGFAAELIVRDLADGSVLRWNGDPEGSSGASSLRLGRRVD